MRLQREAQDIEKNYSDQLVLEIKDAERRVWHVHFTGADGSLYAGERFTLQFKYGPQYPFDSPEVMFVGTPPIHEHVYSCGFICLSTLDTDWTPALKTSSVVLSVLSMLSSATEKRKPDNDEASSRMMKGKSPKEISWLFEDEKC